MGYKLPQRNPLGSLFHPLATASSHQYTVGHSLALLPAGINTRLAVVCSFATFASHSYREIRKHCRTRFSISSSWCLKQPVHHACQHHLHRGRCSLRRNCLRCTQFLGPCRQRREGGGPVDRRGSDLDPDGSHIRHRDHPRVDYLEADDLHPAGAPQDRHADCHPSTFSRHYGHKHPDSHFYCCDYGGAD